MICTAVPATSIHRLTRLLSFNRTKSAPHKILHTASPKGTQLNDLPDEILTCVFEQLDSLSTIYQFALTSQRLYSVAATPRSLASWLTHQKGRRFSIYFAILAMPHLCDDHFIRLLINQGALLSRHLVEQLVLLYGKPPQPSSSFTQSIQQLPFLGYAALIHQGSQLYGNIIVNTNESDYHQLMTGSGTDRLQTWQVGIQEHCFIPAPIVHGTTSYSRHLLRLAETSPDLFSLIAPVFEFDRDARHALWQCLFLLLLDLAFTQHPIEHHRPQLACLDVIISPHKVIRFASPIMRRDSKPEGDLDVFAHAFISFFSKYPTGYCHDQVMHKLLSLCLVYLHPAFDLRLALVKISHDLPPVRKDMADQVDKFLKIHP